MMQSTNSARPHDINRLIAQWQEAKRTLDVAKEAEASLRSLLLRSVFNPSIKEGTETQPVSHGFKLKAIKSVRYCFPHAVAARETMLTLAEEFGVEGQFIANRLIAWKPELIVSEYRKLSPDMQGVVNPRIITKEATPQLVLVAPKSLA